ncbi:MAG: DUF6090 family protein [Balneolaceae bacterium]
MLRFFRQIRKKLMEHPSKGRTRNKVRTYLLYAVGEILLVVIGILLALQVNNWNEERIELNLRDDLIANYAKDLKTNADYIERRKLSVENDLECINQITDRLKASSISTDTLKNIALIEFSPIYYAFSELKNDTFSSLVSNNQLRLMPDELTAWMVDINFRMVDIVSTQKNVAELYRDNLTEYTFKYPMPIEYSLYSTFKTESLWNSLNQDQWMLAFNGVMFTKKAGYTSMLPRADSLLVKIDRVLNYIDSNYSSQN